MIGGFCCKCKREFKTDKLLAGHMKRSKHKKCILWVGTLKEVMKAINYDATRFFT